MIRRVDAAQLIEALTGGQTPSEGDTILFSRKGWTFSSLRWRGALPEDPALMREGDLWFNTTTNTIRLRTGDQIYETSPLNLVE